MTDNLIIIEFDSKRVAWDEKYYLFALSHYLLLAGQISSFGMPKGHSWSDRRLVFVVESYGQGYSLELRANWLVRFTSTKFMFNKLLCLDR